MFKIAYGAGHYLKTAGKRFPASLDKNQTREWTVNNQVAKHFAKAASEYEGVELLRVDDPAGTKNITLKERCAAANKWGADFCLAIHHNAGINCGSGGGIVAFSYKEGTTGAKYRDAIYNACIEAGGLKGDRYDPTQAKGFQALRDTNAPAVLMEYGFMDSKVDAPVILTDAYSKKMAYATMEAIAKVAGLKKKKTTAKVDVGTPYTQKQFIKDVQKACGATVDGIAGPETLSKTPTVSARKNDKHPVVKLIQKRLLALGYVEIGAADGVAGPKFTSAVAHFQQDNDCVTDGEITAKNKTWKKLLGME